MKNLVNETDFLLKSTTNYCSCQPINSAIFDFVLLMPCCMPCHRRTAVSAGRPRNLLWRPWQTRPFRSAKMRSLTTNGYVSGLKSVIFRKVLMVMFDKWWGASSVCVCALLFPLCNMFIAWPRCFSVMRCFILDNLLVETARNVEQEFLGTVHVSSLLSSLGNPFG